MVQFMEYMARHFERSPDPVGRGARRFDLNFPHRVSVKNDRVK
jgi:hypothetical protein